MKVLLLADANSSHVVKWARSLSKQGIEIGIFSLSACKSDLYANGNITLFTNEIEQTLLKKPDGSFAKMKYLRYFSDLKKIIKSFNPDIVHAHYASSYGLLGALSGFHPYVISVWGSDIYDFPNKSILHKIILKYNLSMAEIICSTSHVMADETKNYIDKPIEVTPFGIDLNVFKSQRVDSLFSTQDIVIGTVKTLEEKYGIEYLIKAFAVVKANLKSHPLKLLIVGGGSQEAYLKNMVRDLNIDQDTIFIGKVPYNDVIRYYNMLSISVSVSVSNSESFGVAIIEASACEKPVIVSNVGGLPEVVENGVTGIVVEPRNPEQTARAMEDLILNENMRRDMGKSGRQRVEKYFNWKDNVKQMIDIYTNLLR